jgi:riboflavin kinase/FMN adenylyltransferase
VQIHYGLDKFRAVRPVVTIGTFDGVHLGHRKVIENLKKISQGSSGESVIFTFYPHPRIIVSSQEHNLRLLSTLEEKIVLLQQLGIDHLIIYPFTEEFSKLTYDQFVENILVNQIHLSCLVIGYDHRFGKGRQGDFESLKELSGKLKFNIERLDELSMEDNVISSTKIRKALEDGDVHKANQYLGYEYMLMGKVIEGRQLGRKLGFPTANIETEDSLKLVPGDGVYAVRVEVYGSLYKGMLNIGFRPTIEYNADHRSIEVHIFDFDKDIYHSPITLYFVEKLRNEEKFSGLEELRLAMVRDRERSLKLLE